MDEALRNRLQGAARKLGSSSSAVIRLSILTQLPDIEAGIIRIPKEAK
jgi:hypothetical protein